MRIGLDVMGGDLYPHAPIKGAIAALKWLPSDAQIVLVGRQAVIEETLLECGYTGAAFEIFDAPDFIEMGESPTRAMLAKPQNSIAEGVRLVKEKQLDIYCSAGSTGAFMACGVIGLGVIEGVNRPSIGALFYNIVSGSFSLVTDVGANVDVRFDALVNFAYLGSVYLKTVFGVENPRVALFNVGEERTKGAPEVKKAYEALEKQTRVNFVGNAEGWDLIRGHADVYVCDGFTGNIIMKLVESYYPLLKAKLPDDPEIERFNVETIGGLPLLGVNGNLIIGHGSSSPLAFENMIRRAVELVPTQLPQKIAEAFAGLEWHK